MHPIARTWSAMTSFSVNPHRLDPYQNFKFRVKWDGQYIPGISKVGALRRTTEVVQWRSGADSSTTRKAPGQSKWASIILERGVTHDHAFEDWANKVWRHAAAQGSEVSLANYRKDVILELCNEAGQVVLAYRIFRCWVSEYTALPQLDANETAVAIESITLEHEGWERDIEVPEPTEPRL